MVEQVDRFDIAEGSFVEKMPNWSRWLLFLPAAFLGSLIAVFLIGFLNKISMAWIGVTEEGWAFKVFELAQSGVLGVTFVLFGATVIPKGQFVTSIVLLVIAVLIGALSFLGNIAPESTMPLFTALLHSLAVIIGGGYAVYLVHKGENIYTVNKEM